MIPIFIIVKDRLTVLKQTIESYEKYIKTPIKIILINNCSTYPDTVKFLESGKYDVILNTRLQDSINAEEDQCVKGVHFQADFHFGGLINLYIADMDISHYVVTDPDIAFHEGTKGNVLEFYVHLMEELMEEYASLVCVGPMLDIDDIPEYYPYKTLAEKSHQKQFWSKGTKTIKYDGIDVDYIYAPIDTTFAIYRKSHRWSKYSTDAIRVKQPYTAKHLDWYIDPENMPDDQRYYIENAHEHKGISHWGGYWLKYGFRGIDAKTKAIGLRGCKNYIYKSENLIRKRKQKKENRIEERKRKEKEEK